MTRLPTHSQFTRQPRKTLVSLLLLAASLPAWSQAPTVNAPQVVDAMESVFGVTPGQRRNHTKGTCALGVFVGTPEAAAYSSSALFSGQSIPVIARFSLSGGNPKAPDTSKSVRGMALQFKLPGDSLHHMAMLNVPVFGAAVPQTFLDQFVALKPDPVTGKPDPEKFKAFRASHPDTNAQAEFMAKNNPPTSYANSAYWSIHTFKFNKGKSTPVRWRFVPRDGEKQLSNEELQSSPPQFLEQALITRTQKGPVLWDMVVSIGQPGDPEDNPTLAWPEDRKRFTAGTLSISAAMAQAGAACEGINFDPLVMAEGIAPTQDPVLLFRSAAYAVSFGKRLSGQ